MDEEQTVSCETGRAGFKRVGGVSDAGNGMVMAGNGMVMAGTDGEAVSCEAVERRVRRELERMAFARIGDVIDPETGMPKPGFGGDAAAAVSYMRVRARGEGVEYEVKLCDKNRALELLGKCCGMFTARVALVEERPVIVDDLREAGR